MPVRAMLRVKDSVLFPCPRAPATMLAVKSVHKRRSTVSHSNNVTGIALAVAAAGMLGTTAPVFAGSDASASDTKVHCYGVNKCKGHNDCKTAENACKGQGSCKGHGFVLMSEKACDHLGGKVGK